VGPDPNAPQSQSQNSYQGTDNVTWVRGNHTFKFGEDFRLFIAPQAFTQRLRGDYEYSTLALYLQDVAPDVFGERTLGQPRYYIFRVEIDPMRSFDSAGDGIGREVSGDISDCPRLVVAHHAGFAQDRLDGLIEGSGGGQNSSVDTDQASQLKAHNFRSRRIFGPSSAWVIYRNRLRYTRFPGGQRCGG
jgi:hypothetical protein